MLHDQFGIHQFVKIDWLNPANSGQMDDVLRIEHLTSSTPWNLDEVRWLLRHGHLARIALVGNFMAGFLLYEACRGGRRIVSIAVDPGFQRQGIGSLLISTLKRQMADVPHLTEIVAHVPESRLPVQQFLRASQFRWTETIESVSSEGLYVMRCVKAPAGDDAGIVTGSASETSDQVR
jgi:ribosomal protein S18 acetylase RimI-like enzyme